MNLSSPTENAGKSAKKREPAIVFEVSLEGNTKEKGNRQSTRRKKVGRREKHTRRKEREDGKHWGREKGGAWIQYIREGALLKKAQVESGALRSISSGQVEGGENQKSLHLG